MKTPLNQKDESFSFNYKNIKIESNNPGRATLIALGMCLIVIIVFLLFMGIAMALHWISISSGSIFSAVGLTGAYNVGKRVLTGKSKIP